MRLQETSAEVTRGLVILSFYATPGQCQLFFVKSFQADSLRNGRFFRTFPMGFDRRCNSILREIKAGRREQAASPAMISIGLVLRLHSLLSRSIILVVRCEINSSSGKSKKVGLDAVDLSRQTQRKAPSSPTYPQTDRKTPSLFYGKRRRKWTACHR
jgi:hypothetical protein